MRKVMTLRVRAPREDGLPRLCAILMLVMDWALNRRSVLEDMTTCMSKCASDVANGTGFMSGVSCVPDGVNCELFDPPEVEFMVTSFGKLLFYNSVICWGSSLCFNPTDERKVTAKNDCTIETKHCCTIAHLFEFPHK